LGVIACAARADDDPKWVSMGTEDAAKYGTVNCSVDDASVHRLPNDLVQFLGEARSAQADEGRHGESDKQLTYDCAEGDTYMQHILTHDKANIVLVNDSEHREMSAPPGSMYRKLGRTMCKTVK
jgi:hypothetical protein